MSQPPATPLLKDTSFWGLTVTQFLGAFNDNLFKQLLLLMAVPVGAASLQLDQQGLATVVFALPFVIGSGFAGYLSDRYSKRRVIVLAKVAEIVVMLMGLAGFLAYATFGYNGLLVVLFLMGLHSTFFGPGKYGILPEMFREDDLPRANGMILMTTFLAIIFGTVTAGGLKVLILPAQQSQAAAQDASRLAIGSAVCVGIAILGTLTSLWVRPLPAALPGLKLTWDALSVPHSTRQLLLCDRPLLKALLATCAFWFVAGITVPAVNSLGMRQLGLDELHTSLLTTFIAVGIMIGSLAGGALCRRWPHGAVVRLGAWGLTLLSFVMSISVGGRHLLDFWGSVPMLTLLGASAGLFAIPIQVFIQARPPEGQKGRMVAVMNQVNFLAILMSGLVYWLADRILEARGLPRSYMFLLMGLFILPVACFYRLPELHQGNAPTD